MFKEALAMHELHMSYKTVKEIAPATLDEYIMLVLEIEKLKWQK